MKHLAIYSAVSAIVVLIGSPVLHLSKVWWNDPREPAPKLRVGEGDYSRLEANQAKEVVAIESDPAAAEAQLAALVRRAAARLETSIGQTGAKLRSRNEIMTVPSDWFSNREPDRTEILHEYFVPPARLAEFLEACPVFQRH